MQEVFVGDCLHPVAVDNLGEVKGSVSSAC